MIITEKGRKNEKQSSPPAMGLMCAGVCSLFGAEIEFTFLPSPYIVASGFLLWGKSPQFSQKDRKNENKKKSSSKRPLCM